MIIYIIGVPIFIGVIRSANLPGAVVFISAYVCLLLSNIFTVLEEFWFAAQFNFLEHVSITISAVLFFAAIGRLLASRSRKNRSAGPWNTKL